MWILFVIQIPNVFTYLHLCPYPPVVCVCVALRVVLHPRGGLEPEVFRAASAIKQPSLGGGGTNVPCSLALLTENSKGPVPEALRMEARGLGECF